MINKSVLTTIIGSAALSLLKSGSGSSAKDGVYRPKNYSGFANTAKSKARAKKYTALSFDKWGDYYDSWSGEYNPFILPPSLENFVNVERIEFNNFDMPISALPDFSKMPKLKKVFITSSKIGTHKILKNKNMKMEAATERSQKMFQKRFLEAIFACTNLEILYIEPSNANSSDRGFLVKLPDSIGNLVNLKQLNLVDMRLTSIPRSIGNLIQLEHLDLSKNQLTSLPSSITNLTLLSNLKLKSNKFINLPDYFSLIGVQGRGLKVDLSWNPFESIPQILGQTKMETLDFIGNMKESFPSLASTGWGSADSARYYGGFEIYFNAEGEGEVSFMNDSWHKTSLGRLIHDNPRSYPNFTGVVKGFSDLQIFNIKKIKLAYFNLNLSYTFFNTLRNMNIKDVILNRCWIANPDNLPDSIESLWFDGCFGFTINDEFWQKISHLENLRSLKITYLEKSKNNNYSISSDILKLKSLQSLDVPRDIKMIDNEGYRVEISDYLVSPSKSELINWLRSGKLNGDVTFEISKHIKDETQSQLRRF